MAQNQPSQNFTMEQIMAFAASPTGKQLLSMLQQSSNTDLEKAKEYAAAGDMEQTKTALSSLLSDPAVRALIKQFGG